MWLMEAYICFEREEAHSGAAVNTDASQPDASGWSLHLLLLVGPSVQVPSFLYISPAESCQPVQDVAAV